MPTDVETLVRDQLEAQRHRIEERDLTVTHSLGRGRSMVLVDPGLLARLVDHLLGNAIRYTPLGGTIGVYLDSLEAGGGLRLAVENSGPGIAAEDLPHLFEPFYRADRARTRSEEGGHGLGLALVASIARLHGGTVVAASAPGKNTRLEVALPAPPAN